MGDAASTNAGATATATDTTTATALATATTTKVKGNMWVTGQRLAVAWEDGWWRWHPCLHKNTDFFNGRYWLCFFPPENNTKYSSIYLLML